MNQNSFTINITPKERRLIAKGQDYGLYESTFVLQHKSSQNVQAIEVIHRPLLSSPYTKLVDFLDSYFDLEELQILCIALDIDFEEISGNSIHSKITALIDFLERRGMIEQMLASIKKEWPQMAPKLIEYGFEK